jgi:hypothetical protein
MGVLGEGRRARRTRRDKAANDDRHSHVHDRTRRQPPSVAEPHTNANRSDKSTAHPNTGATLRWPRVAFKLMLTSC